MGNIMKLENMSPVAIAEELGNRLKQARLNSDLTQAEVASRTGLNRRTILNAEKGKVQLENLVAIFVSLDMADQLNMLLPVQEISPIQLAKLKGKKRQRASRSKYRKARIKEDKPSW
jgi:putative transcriptional regulator